MPGQGSGLKAQDSARKSGAPSATFRLVPSPHEIVLRVSARDSRREAIERFTKEFAPLVTSGPPGIAGYAAGRPQVRKVYAYWPTLVPKEHVQPAVEVRRTDEWMS